MVGQYGHNHRPQEPHILNRPYESDRRAYCAKLAGSLLRQLR